MRFLSNGPNIPDRLLKARDDGQVVFLCGAGVSMPCGMPGFKSLTEGVLSKLKVQDDADAQKAFSFWRPTPPGQREIPDEARPSFDLIFNMLQQSYGRDEVGKIVAEHLAASTACPSCWHRTVARLSADRVGRPQIVTTNFDLLFEDCGIPGGVTTHVPPTLPDLRYNQPISGITYLHGRLNQSPDGPHNYVLSSSDFGRAYIAEGWATGFMRLLLERFTVVLLGYTATDPPMKYLLQGLNSADALKPDKLFAFDWGEPDMVEAKWRDRGVTPIAYGGEDDHAALWDSLDAWVARADSPTAWRTQVIDMARRGPGSLAAHERGQVAHLVRDNLGAREFADAKPPPPAEWLCVFDRSCRTGKLFEGPGEEGERFDPLTAYGLDDDPPRVSGDVHKTGDDPDDLLSWRSGDNVRTDQIRLGGGRGVRGYEALPPRMDHLARWICGQVKDPVVAWWAARQSGLHPRLARMITDRIEDAPDMPEPGRSVWNVILNSQERDYMGPGDMEWRRTRKKIARPGWTPQTLRDFSRGTEPVIKLDLPHGVSWVRPPSGTWPGIKQDDVLRPTVKFREYTDAKLSVPDAALPMAFNVLNRNLLLGIDYLNEIESPGFHVPSLYPSDEEDGGARINRSNWFIRCFLDILERMVILYPVQVAATATLWPKPEPIVFDKLRLFVWNKPRVFLASQAAELVLNLEQDAFWSPYNRRGLLFLLRDRWSDFTTDDRLAVEARLLAGPEKQDDQTDEAYSRDRAQAISEKLTWLVQAGCAISDATAAALVREKRNIPDRDYIRGGAASEISRGRVGWVTTNPDPGILLNVADADIVATVLAQPGRAWREFTEKRPFKGLVADYPARAINALELSARKGEYPAELWHTLIHDWPDTAPEQATRMFHDCLRRLPAGVLQEIRHPVGDWIRNKIPVVAEQNESYALSLLDDLLDRLLSKGKEVTDSNIGDSFEAGQRIVQSRRTYGHAIIAVTGKAVDALTSILVARKLPEGSGLPEAFSTRFDRLLASPGEGSDHALAVLTQDLCWLNYIAPEWTRSRLLPLFATGHQAAEPAWNGLLNSQKIPQPELFAKLKSQLLSIFPQIYEWHWDSSDLEYAHNLVAQTCIRHHEDDSYTSYDEAITCIRMFTTSGRVDVIRFLGQLGQSGKGAWENAVAPFITNAWPREREYQIEVTSAAFVSLLEDCGDQFSVVLAAVQSFLRPIRGNHRLDRFYESMRDDDTPVTSKFPIETLSLMDAIIPGDPVDIPFGLGQVLDLISKTRPEATSDHRFIRLRELVAAC